MRPPSLKETNALRRALLKETGDADDPVQALRIHRALSQGHIAVLPHVEVSPAFGHAPLYLVLWASLELSVFVTTAAGDLVRVKTIALWERLGHLSHCIAIILLDRFSMCVSFLLYPILRKC